MIYLPGDPVSQQRARIFAKGAMDPCWKAKEQHRAYIRERYKIEYVTEPSEIHLVFSYAYLKTTSKAKRVPSWKGTRPDIDNLVKYILDMSNGLLWEDDSCVATIYATKIFTDTACTVVHIRPVTEGNMLANLAYIGASK